jgi:putative Mn2+ efflux pump MntP
MTRAISCIFHGQWLAAFQYNKQVVIVFPLLVFISLKMVIQDFRNQHRGVKNQYAAGFDPRENDGVKS